jgi:hypothetical protein
VRGQKDGFHLTVLQFRPLIRNEFFVIIRQVMEVTRCMTPDIKENEASKEAELVRLPRLSRPYALIG